MNMSFIHKRYSCNNNAEKKKEKKEWMANIIELDLNSEIFSRKKKKSPG